MKEEYPMKKYRFNLTIEGIGETPDEAYQDAVDNICQQSRPTPTDWICDIYQEPQNELE
jgi:hypothetical protein